MITTLKKICLGLLLSVVIIGVNAGQAAAFNPNRIIDDGVFTNYNSMSVSDIQNFLNSKVPSCSPGYTCLRSYSEGGKSAAQIIHENAQNFGINPQVLIVTLQKENGLVTHTSPESWRYRTAMGFACPDNGSCNPEYYGFAKQVYQGSRHLRNFFDQNPNWFIPHRTGVNNVKYHPNAGCGTSQLNINKATSALYSYTPYQPNAAALGNMYGTGDSCSSYGNRNFWRDFTVWFGSTYGSAFQAGFSGQSASPILAPGGSAQGYFNFRNDGTSAWYDDASIGSAPAGNYPMHLATTYPLNRGSMFGTSWGPERNRPALNFSAVYEANGTTLAANQHIVQPGQIARVSFTFNVPADASPGVYREHFRLVREGTSDGGINDLGTYLEVTVTPNYSSQFHAQGDSPVLKQGQTKTSFISYKNTSNAPWYDDLSRYGGPAGTLPVHLATSHPINRVSVFGSTWDNGNRPTYVFNRVYESDGTTLAANQHVVQPGQIAQFNFDLKAPANGTPNTYTEYFQPIVEGGSTMNDPGTYLEPTIIAAPVGSSAESNVDTLSLQPGETKQLTLSFTNEGSISWNSGVYLTPKSTGDTQKFKHSSWASATNAAPLNEASVPTNGTGTFTVTIQAPLNGGNYRIEFAPSNDGDFFGDPAATIDISVAAAQYGAAYAGQSDYPSIGQTQSAGVYFRYKNTGNVAWYDDTSIGSAPSGAAPVRLATSHPTNRPSTLGSTWENRNRAAKQFSAVYEADGTTLAANQHIVQPGQIGRFNFTFTTSANTGTGVYREYLKPLPEGFPDGTMNDPGTYLDVTVRPAFSVAYAGQSNYPVIPKGQTAPGYFNFRNTGGAAWYDDTSIGGAPEGTLPIHLATNNPINRASQFGDSAWNPHRNRPAVNLSAVYEADGTTLAANQHIVQPGQIGRFTFTFTVSPTQQSGVYREYFRPVIEGTPTGGLNDPGTYLDITVP